MKFASTLVDDLFSITYRRGRFSTCSLAIVISSLLCFLAAYEYPAFAADLPIQTEGTIKIDGLTFPCSGCEQTHGGRCAIWARTDRAQIMSCTKVRSLFLDNLAARKGIQSLPEAQELMSFLLQGEPTGTEAVSAISLLVRTDVGQNLMSTYIVRLQEHYQPLLEEVTLSGDLPKPLLAQLWQVISVGHSERDARLQACIAFANKEFGLSSLYQRLSAQDLMGDAEKLAFFRLAIGKQEQVWNEEFARLIAFLNACTGAHTDEDWRTLCLGSPDPVSAEAQHYISRVRLNVLLAQLGEQQYPPEKSLELISSLDYRENDTRELNDAVLAVVERLNSETDWHMASEVRRGDYLGLLLVFAKADPRIAKMLALGDALAARSAFLEHQETLVLDLLERSNRWFPGEIKERQQIIESIVDGIEQEDLQDRLVAMLAPEIQAARQRQHLALSAAIGCAIFVVLVLCLRVWESIRARRIRKYLYGLEEKEQQQLMDLIAFFGLSLGCSIDQLSHAFRDMAKKVHPDVKGGTADEFQDVKQKYTQAKKLLERILPTPRREK